MRFILAGLFIVILSGDVFAQQRLPKAKDVEQTIINLSTWSENVDKESFYDQMIFKDKESNKIIKFKDLSDIEKDVFYILQAEIVGNQLFSMSMFVTSVKPAPDSTDPDRLPNAKDLSEFNARIQSLRKSHALKFEKVVESIFKKHEKTIPEYDRKMYMLKITSWHDQYKLINRKK